MKKISLAVVSCGFFALVAGSAIAQEQGGVVIGGNANIKAKTGDVTTKADGKNALAETNIGAVTGKNTKVGGNVDINVKTGNVTTTATGKNAAACSNVGMIGTSACQSKK